MVSALAVWYVSDISDHSWLSWKQHWRYLGRSQNLVASDKRLLWSLKDKYNKYNIATETDPPAF